MNYFLQDVAKDIYQRFKDDLSNIAIIFPNKRAGLFFNEYLFDENKDGTPMWTPSYYSIGDFFDLLCPIAPDDSIETICRLYKICKKRKPDLNLNSFYSWGQQLMNDFNNVDKNLVDARQLFSNTMEALRLEELKLEKERLDDLRAMFAPHHGSNIKEEFQQIWSNLFSIYTELNEQLRHEGIAYQGARYRMVANGLRDGGIILPEQFKTYIFVGFNVLLKSEQVLLDYIKEQEKGLYYWDTDPFFMSRHNSFPYAMQLHKNILRYGNEIKDSEQKNVFPKITYVASSSNNAQARYVTQWLEAKDKDGQPVHIGSDERKSAIVLCDETLLQPVLHSFPKEKLVNKINITKGFPLSHTPAFSFVANFFQKNKIPVLHPQSYLENLWECIKNQWAEDKNVSDKWLYHLYTESYYKCYTTVGRIIHIIEKDLITPEDTPLLPRLILQILRAQNIPFHGEPATGLQIMGMLETRNLDFDHILMLSVNEGNIPKRSNEQSFIPYDLRIAYGLTTNKDESEVYAYNFFRLLHRTKSITFLYNNALSGDNLGEKSRFLQQLQLQTDIPIEYIELEEYKELPSLRTDVIAAEYVEQAMAKRQTLSPSAINDYVECPMKFYFRHIAKLKDLPRPNQLLQANTLGSIFHETMNMIYDQLIAGKERDTDGAFPITGKEILGIMNMESDQDTPSSELIAPFLTEAFLTVSIQDGSPDRENSMAYRQLLMEHPEEQLYKPSEHEAERETLIRYIIDTLKYDAKQDNLRIIEMEQRHNTEISGLNVGGYIDRLDMVRAKDGKNIIRVLDYKT